ncbi:MAG: substrate-binding domain-containing protein [Cytophagales bacterium]|nr:substrate-binding domain-containing protein [Cytophagales bacterium]
MKNLKIALLQVILTVACSGVLQLARAEQIVLASTTTTEQSGLLAQLLPAFVKDTGVRVKPIIFGTGQALDAARRGDADVLFTHDRMAEEKFITEGLGVQRFDVMYNDFILIGPGDDPAKTAGRDIVKALLAVARSNATFYSRGDRSGTHEAELRYWQMGGVKDKSQFGTHYKECGCGVGQALNLASATAGAYVLADRGSWLNFKNRGPLKILVEGDSKMRNQYGVMVVNPAKHPHVKALAAQVFVDWVTGARGQAAINAYKINGEQLFFANANVNVNTSTNASAKPK